MKRLSKKNKRDQEIADYIFNHAKELLAYQPTIDYMKKVMKDRNITVEDMQNDEYDMESIIKGTLKQCLDLYDGVRDNFFDPGPGKTTWENDSQNRGSESSITVSDILDNFEQYGKSYTQLFDSNLQNALKGTVTTSRLKEAAAPEALDQLKQYTGNNCDNLTFAIFRKIIVEAYREQLQNKAGFELLDDFGNESGQIVSDLYNDVYVHVKDLLEVEDFGDVKENIERVYMHDFLIEHK